MSSPQRPSRRRLCRTRLPASRRSSPRGCSRHSSLSSTPAPPMRASTGSRSRQAATARHRCRRQPRCQVHPAQRPSRSPPRSEMGCMAQRRAAVALTALPPRLRRLWPCRPPPASATSRPACCARPCARSSTTSSPGSSRPLMATLPRPLAASSLLRLLRSRRAWRSTTPTLPRRPSPAPSARTAGSSSRARGSAVAPSTSRARACPRAGAPPSTSRGSGAAPTAGAVGFSF